MALSFTDKVVIITGAGLGLGRSHALDFAKRGAKVLVNDLGGDVHGAGASLGPAEQVVEQIIHNGGESVAHGADVSDPKQVDDMVNTALKKWGRVDVLVNNAGILRDKSFSKMTVEDFQKVLQVHVLGSMICTKAVWDTMREQNFGRVIMTSSPSGLYGNFGQTNYGCAKLGLVGFMNTLKLEGAKYNIHTNAIAPAAATRMTEELLPPEILAMLQPEMITPAVVYLACDDAPNGVVLCCGGGFFATAQVTRTQGLAFAHNETSAENIAKHWQQIADPSQQQFYEQNAEEGADMFAQIQAANKKDNAA